MKKVFCFQIPGLRTGVRVYNGLLLRVLVVRDYEIHIHLNTRVCVCLNPVTYTVPEVLIREQTVACATGVTGALIAVFVTLR